MPAATKVRPRKWNNIRVLFDNGWYSVIVGHYEGEHKLGQRWNGEKGHVGFPSQGGHPTWHVVPPFLVHSLLLGLRDELTRNSAPADSPFAKAIEQELARHINA